MFEIKRVLEANGHPVEVLRAERAGHVVREDEMQVIAETRTGL